MPLLQMVPVFAYCNKFIVNSFDEEMNRIVGIQRSLN